MTTKARRRPGKSSENGVFRSGDGQRLREPGGAAAEYRTVWGPLGAAKGNVAVDAGDKTMPTLAALERRRCRLEEETGDAGDSSRLPWFAQYAESLSDEEFEVEADWLIPMWMRHFIRGGMPGYPNHDGGGGLAEHPDIATLWR